MTVQAPTSPVRPLVPTAWRARVVGVIVAAAVLLVPLAIAVQGGRRANAFDRHVVIWLLDHIGRRTGSAMIQLIGVPLMGLLYAGIVAWALCRGDRILAVLAALAPPAAILVTEYVLKPVVARHIGGHRDPLDGYAFPSGHTTALTALLTVASIAVLRSALPARWRAVWFAVAVLWTLDGAIALTYNLYHYASDTVGGALVGVGGALGAALAVDAVAARRSARQLT